MKRFSLAIIGSGSGNSIVPSDPDGTVAFIERGTFGGTCINRGCIPSKMLLHSADVAYDIKRASTFDVDAEVNGVDWPAMRDRVFGKTDSVVERGQDFRQGQDHVTLYESTARFTGPNQLQLDDGTTIEADQIVIATGSSPIVPPPFADAEVEVLTSDDVMRMDALPASMIVVGGGYVAIEQAHLFASLGVDVTVIEAADRLIPSMDKDVSARFTELATERWTVALGTKVTEVRQDAGGVAVTTDDGSSYSAERILVAIGRQPNTDLDLDAAGIKLTDDGRIAVDDFGQAAPGVWALGDCSSPYPLKHVANAEARIIAHNLAHPDDLRPLPHEAVPSAVFTEPQIASVGLRCQDMDDVEHVEARTPFGDTAYGWALRDTSGFCKLYADPATGTLLGAHIIGPEAALLLTPLIQAMAHGQRVADLARGQYWIHPALSEVVEQALLALDVDQTVRSGQQH